MSSINQAFWYKSQRALIGTMPMSRFTLAVNSSGQLSAAAITYMINGAWGSTVAITAGSSTLPTKALFVGGLHANNPQKIVSSDAGDITVVQNFLDLTVAALSHVRALVTISGTGAVDADQNATEAKLHFYAGEIVLATETAVRPDLDLSDECPLAEILFNNTTSGDVATGAAASYTYYNSAITDVAFVTSV